MNFVKKTLRIAVTDCRSLFTLKNIALMMGVWIVCLALFSGFVGGPLHYSESDGVVTPPRDQALHPAKWLGL